MKSLLLSALLSVVLLSATSLADSDRNNNNNNNNIQTGAVYQISNGSPYNAVLVWSVSPDGIPTCRKLVPTGGAGAGANAGADPLHSEGAVTVLRNNLFVVNAGSNTLTYFTIDRDDATALNFIGSADSQGDFPISVAAYGQRACVLNGGVRNSIACFQFDPLTGLTLLPEWTRNLNVDLRNGFPLSKVAFSPDGRALVVSIKAPAPAAILVFTINNNQLAASPSTIVPSGAAAPFGFRFSSTRDRNGDFIVFVTDPRPAAAGGPGADVFSLNSVSGLSRNAASSPLLVIPGAAAPCWSAYSAVTGTFFAVDAGTGALTEVGVDVSGGAASTLTPRVLRNITIGRGVGLFDTEVFPVSRRQDYVFALGARSALLYQFSLSSSSFVLSSQTPLPAFVTSSVQGMAVYQQRRNTEPSRGERDDDD